MTVVVVVGKGKKGGSGHPPAAGAKTSRAIPAEEMQWFRSLDWKASNGKKICLQFNSTIGCHINCGNEHQCLVCKANHPCTAHHTREQ